MLHIYIIIQNILFLLPLKIFWFIVENVKTIYYTQYYQMVQDISLDIFYDSHSNY